MKKTFYLAAAAALLMVSSAAQAGGFSFEIDGQRIHIDAPRNCNSLSCIAVTNNGSAINLRKLNAKGKKSDDDDDVASNPPLAKQPAPAAQAPATAPAPAPVANNAPPAPPPATTTYAPPAPPASAPVADASRERLTGLPSTSTRTSPPAPTASPAPVINAAPASPPVAANAAPASQAPAANNPQPLPADAAAAPNTPVGLWQTADNKGNVRIEPCGANLCGFADKTNERILINMKASGEKWTGRIHDPDSGSNYDSVIAMKGPNLLKVQGCALGGLFCGGQTWKRIS